MKTPKFNRVAVGVLGIAMALGFSASPAAATTSCGSFGAELNIGGFCEITYFVDDSADMVRSFTVPAGASDLQAIIVGAGMALLVAARRRQATQIS